MRTFVRLVKSTKIRYRIEELNWQYGMLRFTMEGLFPALRKTSVTNDHLGTGLLMVKFHNN